MAMAVGDEQPRPNSPGEGVSIGPFRYLRAPRPLRFPDQAEMPEGKLQFELRSLLYALLRHAFAREANIGADQFVYWDPTDPSACLAPDAFVRLGAPDTYFKSWKVWERGAPELAVEILSDADDSATWQRKLAGYARLGVRELVSFAPERPEPRLRVWDRLEGDFVERQLQADSAASSVLPGHWLVVMDAELGPTLRLSRDAAGTDLFLTPAEAGAEARQREAEARQREAEARQREAEARQREAEARSAAEARVRELEAELARTRR